MKRTKQAYFRPHHTDNQNKDISGVTFVFGQDNNYHERTKYYQNLQKQALDRQMKQKKQKQMLEKEEKRRNDQQTLQINRYRGQLGITKHQRIFKVSQAHDNYNLQLAEERKMKQKIQKQRILDQEKRQIELLNQRNIKRIIPQRNR